MADDNKASKKAVAKKASVKKTVASKKVVARKKAVAKKTAVSKKKVSVSKADQPVKDAAQDTPTPAATETTSTAKAGAAMQTTAADDKQASAKNAEEKKALADKILAVTGGKPDVAATSDAGAKSQSETPSGSAGNKESVVATKVEQKKAEATDKSEDKPSSGRSQPVIPMMSPEEDMSSCMEDFRKTFEASAKRWEIIVYPSLLAFIFLAAIGFYMVYMLTGSVSRIADNIDGVGNNMNQVSINMTSMTRQIDELNERMKAVTGHMEQISSDVSHQVKSMDAVVAHMGGMNQSTRVMSATMQQMQRDTAIMGYDMHSASRPMRFMNSFMPW